ncbi:MAG: uridine kinase family protein [Nanobdellota archaeon]
MEIIGICGPSCSGKSSVAKALSKKLHCDIIHVDLYYISGCEKTYITVDNVTIRSFERPHQYDGNKVASLIEELDTTGTAKGIELETNKGKSQVAKVFHKKQYLIVEGFHIFNYPRLEQIFDKKYFIDIPFELSVSRRLKRDGDQRDKEFVLIGKQEWARFGAKQKEKADSIFDGAINPEHIANEIYMDITSN